jgi:GT2 family glycosyltransferase
MNTLSVVIPTYRRGEVLLDTLKYLLELGADPLEILIVDQTKEHPPQMLEAFRSLLSGSFCEHVDTEREARSPVRRIVLPEPSIPHAMNVGLQEARGEIVLFLDDDIIPDADLLAAHKLVYKNDPDMSAVVGQVLQPEDDWATAENRSTEYSGIGFSKQKRRDRTLLESLHVGVTGFSASFLRRDLKFRFNSSSSAWVENVMAGNLSVRREAALKIGGFDENFVPPVSFRFETEFAKRLVAAGGKIRFEPRASIRHLRAGQGGTRSKGSHLTSASPIHGVGDYYYAMIHGSGLNRLVYMAIRPLRQVRTKFHLSHPWYIPVKLVGELRAIVEAIRLYRRGPRLIRHDASMSQGADS